MNLKDITRAELLDYLAAQVNGLFPDKYGADTRPALEADFDEALARLRRCINGVRMWQPETFDYLHSSQHCTLVYYLANTIWRNRAQANICTKLFNLNKALHGFDCFYDNVLPDIFFVGHSVGIVLARTTFRDYLVLYQGCTVGRNHGAAPVLGEGVVLYPHAAIIGNCRIGDRSVLAQGCSVVDADTPGDCYVFSQGGKLTFKKPKRNVLSDIFRLEATERQIA